MNIHYDPNPVRVTPATVRRRTSGTQKRTWPDDRSLAGKFMSKICYAGDCIIWTDTLNESGYGILQVGGKPVRAHRISYELQYGPIPPGLVIDHLCRNRCCVNPAHLEAVTDKVNIHRGQSRPQWEARAAQTHCKHGHPFDESNTYHWNAGNPRWRACKTCHYYTKKGLRLMKRFGYEPRSL